jgi:DNA-binding NarL/FixJ family response regulator
VAAGEAIFGPAVATRVRPTSPPATHAHPFPDLTAREREVLDLIAISAISAKLQVADRTQAILRARDAGLGHPRAGRPGGRRQ